MSRTRSRAKLQLTRNYLSESLSNGIFADRRKQQIPFPAHCCRRSEARNNEVYDARPWWLKANYLTDEIAVPEKKD